MPAFPLLYYHNQGINVPMPDSIPPAAERIQQLAAWIDDHRHLWEPRAFIAERLPWEKEWPLLAEWLRGLSDDEIDRLDAGLGGMGGSETRFPTTRDAGPPPRAASGPDAFAMLAAASRSVSALPRLRAVTPSALAGQAPPPRLLRHQVPARKWSQIQAFVSVSAPLWRSGTTRIVEWCSGKGHLGRLAGWASDLPVLHLDRQKALLAAAERLDRAAGVTGTIREADALTAGAWEEFGPGIGALGLHACGALNDALLEEGARRGAAWLIAATCCYHKSQLQDGFYLPRSNTGRRCDLRLDKHQVRLAIYDEVVARPRMRRARRREMAYRAGFDLLHRQATGTDSYASAGPLPPQLFRLPFGEFCAAVQERTQLELPAAFDASQALVAGEEWARRTRALGLIRGVFRRPLEVWLLLDRVCRQEEAGRKVVFGTFCHPCVTPRNLALISTPT